MAFLSTGFVVYPIQSFADEIDSSWGAGESDEESVIVPAEIEDESPTEEVADTPDNMESTEDENIEVGGTEI